VAHGFAIAGRRAPCPFAVAECWRGRNRGQKNRDVFHRFKDAGAFEIAGCGFCDEVQHRRWRFRARGLQIIQKNRAQLRFLSSDLLREELCNDGPEEKPPEIESAVEIVKPEWLDAEIGLFEKFCGAIDGDKRLRRCRSDGRGIEKADAKTAQFFARNFVSRCGDAEGIARIRTGEHVEQSAKIRHGARHRTYDADPAEGTVAGRNVARGWDAAGSGLKPANSTEMRRDADGAAAVATDSAEGAAGSDGCRFAAAGAAGRVGEIPWIASGAVDAIVGFVGHEEFRRVGATEKNGSRCEKAFDNRR